jgi:murein DD-endopeptidase MepM/ murein hydrolase activator NlpD
LDKKLELQNLAKIQIIYQITIISNNDNSESHKITQFSATKNKNNPINSDMEVANKTTSKSAIKNNEASENSNNIAENSLEKVNHFIWPIKGEVISQFGPKQGGLYNDGINIKANQGSIIKTSDAGVVAYVGNELKSYGNLIIIKHKNGWISAYAHLSKILVQNGQKIQPETTIGEVGKSGNVKFPQLYFSLRKGRDAVNPENYLNYK